MSYAISNFNRHPSSKRNSLKISKKRRRIQRIRPSKFKLKVKVNLNLKNPRVDFQHIGVPSLKSKLWTTENCPADTAMAVALWPVGSNLILTKTRPNQLKTLTANQRRRSRVAFSQVLPQFSSQSRQRVSSKKESSKLTGISHVKRCCQMTFQVN